MNAGVDERVVEVRRAWTAASEAEWELLRWMSGEAAVLADEADHRELAARGRRARAVWDELLAQAPAAPTPEWPGAWRLVHVDGRFGGVGGHRDVNAHPTREAAAAELYRRRSRARSQGSDAWEAGGVVWAATDRARKIAFDHDFWSQR